MSFKNRLTDESFDAQGLNFHVDQQSAVRLYQCRGKSNAGLGMGQFDDTRGNTVDQTGDRRAGYQGFEVEEIN